MVYIKGLCLSDTFTRKVSLKGTVTLMTSMFYQKELYKPLILIQVSSKSVEKWGSYGHLKNSIWPTFSRHFEYLFVFIFVPTAQFLIINTITSSVCQQTYLTSLQLGTGTVWRR